MEALTHLGWQAWISIGVVIGAFALFAAGRGTADAVTTAGLTLLLVTGVLTPAEALAGFANPGMLTVAVLYVVATGLTETGAVDWIGQTLLGRPRSPTHARWRLMAPTAALSAVLNNTPLVAILIPAVQDWAKRYRLEPSRLMIPLSYAAIAGGTCSLIGTSTNLVVDGLYRTHSAGTSLGLFEPAWIGMPVVMVVIVFLLTAGHWLLPRRPPADLDFADVRQYTAEMLVPQGSALAGKGVEEAGLRQLPGLFLIEIERGGQIMPAVSPQELLRVGDRLVFAGIIDSVMDLHRLRGLIPATDQVFKLGGPRQDRCFVEAVLSDSGPLIGRSVREGRFRNRYNAAILAVARNGERIRRKIGDIELQAGDTLLLECRAEFVEQQRNSRDFLLVSQIGNRRPLRHERAPAALAIVGAMIATATLGWLTMLEASLLAAGLLLATRCTDTRTARAAPDWQVLVVIATSFGIATALEKTGAAGALAGALIGLSQGVPWATLALVFVATAILTALATNNVAAVLVFPIAMAAAQEVQASPLPFVFTVMVAASASFATPIGYQTNLMVFNVGGYRFSDFLRVGVPITVAVGIVTVALTPLIWPF